MTISLLALLILAACGTVSHGPIDRLAAEQLPVSYVNDGAGDATVMNLGADSDGAVTEPPPALRDLVLAGERSVPLLIECLQDTRKTTATYGPAAVDKVPLGFVCLDVLVHVVRGPVHVEDCAYDGMGACVQEAYYFMPDATAAERARVQAAWQELWNKKLLKFETPSWWRPVV
jgi:hypothetical protein